MKKRYRDLEHLLFKGFIPFKVQVNGLNLVLKTVSDLEYERIKLMSGLENDPQYVSFFNINYLFYSIFMIDGLNILGKREENYSDFIDVLKQFPNCFFKCFSLILEDLTKRQNNCIIQVEQYVYENESRYNWEFKKNLILNSLNSTSIQGTDLLGINQFQKYWAILNIREDNKIKFKENYSLAKFLASFQDPKALRKIEQLDKNREEEEEKRKERIRVMGTAEEIKYLSDPSDTREGIVEALEKQMRGEKDDHDLFIEEYEKRMRMDMLKKINDMNKVREMRNKQLEDIGEEVRAISKDELIERLEKIKKRKENAIQHSEFSPEQSSKFYQMSNIKDSDLIREENFISEEDYRKLLGDEDYKKVSGLSEADSKRIEQEYLKQQKTIAAKYGFDEESEIDLDFPHLKR
jgi:hypothetical protein